MVFATADMVRERTAQDLAPAGRAAIFDTQFNKGWRMELSSYPLFICTKPEVLMTGRARS